MRRRKTWGTQEPKPNKNKRNDNKKKERKKLEPLSSTSRLGARAAQNDKYPRDFGPRIAYCELRFRYHSASYQEGRERNVRP